VKRAMIYAGGLFGSIYVGAVAFFNWNFNQPAVSAKALNSIQTGASKAEVVKVLGEPTSKYAPGNKWAYFRTMGWSVVTVYFDENERYTFYKYDY
jgi:hypothetical protein